MKLLLTSSGVNNRSIRAALAEMVNKPASECKVAMIPTAINAEGGNKDWYVGQFINLWRAGYCWIDVVEPGVAPDWKERLADVDIIFVSGGNTFFLLDQSRKSGFDKWLKANMKDKIYIGSSAGSLFATPSIAGAGIGGGDKNLTGIKDLTGMNLVDFEFMPHVGNGIAMDDVAAYAKTTRNKVYAADDQTAIKVINGKVEVISEGSWKEFN